MVITLSITVYTTLVHDSFIFVYLLSPPINVYTNFPGLCFPVDVYSTNKFVLSNIFNCILQNNTPHKATVLKYFRWRTPFSQFTGLQTDSVGNFFVLNVHLCSWFICCCINYNVLMTFFNSKCVKSGILKIFLGHYNSVKFYPLILFPCHYSKTCCHFLHYPWNIAATIVLSSVYTRGILGFNASRATPA